MEIPLKKEFFRIPDVNPYYEEKYIKDIAELNTEIVDRRFYEDTKKKKYIPEIMNVGNIKIF